VFGKLFIYDTGDDDNREQAEGRFDGDDGVVALPCGSQNELLAGLDRLRGHAIFDRVLVQTHGGPGRITIGGDHLFWTFFGSYIKDMGYDVLFPYYTRIYFDGCNVGAEQGGTDFLEAVGGTLLKRGGGEVYGWTSAGYGYSSWIPFIGGHTVHFSGELKKLYFDPGGVKVSPPPSHDSGGLRSTGRFRH
jgi:hypothetical protein